MHVFNWFLHAFIYKSRLCLPCFVPDVCRHRYRLVSHHRNVCHTGPPVGNTHVFIQTWKRANSYSCVPWQPKSSCFRYLTGSISQNILWGPYHGSRDTHKRPNLIEYVYFTLYMNSVFLSIMISLQVINSACELTTLHLALYSIKRSLLSFSTSRSLY